MILNDVFELLLGKALRSYGGVPFWAWNCNVTSELIQSQIGYFEEMGMSGFTIHSRTGLEVPYLGDEFMARVKESIEEAKSRGMRVWLYDEDRWPSGFAGGYVTKEEKHRARYLVFSPWEGGISPGQECYTKRGRLDLIPNGKGRLIAKYVILLEGEKLKSYGFSDNKKSEEEIWYLYEEVMEADLWFNGQTYMNTLSEETTDYFLKITHEKYKKELGEDFGKTAAAIFTDEPQFVHKRFLQTPNSKEAVILPYTEGFEKTFHSRYGIDFIARLPELIWETIDSRSMEIRYYYHRFLLELFAESYCDTVGAWCQTNGIVLTGHLKGEGSLWMQTDSLGETMRNYLNFQIPGIDILCDKREYTTAKQAQSAARQLGRNRVMSELYGVTNWDFDFRRHKLQGDWQAALGVTERVHHLSWMSMEGEAKRDFPASIFYQSPWYKEYVSLEQYFSRINRIMSEGNPVVHVGVIHPVESFWMIYGAAGNEGEENRQERLFQDMAKEMLFNLIDFDYISEALLEKIEVSEKPRGCYIGNVSYRIIIIPGLLTIRETTLDRLKQFQDSGGILIFMGKIPEYMDAKKSKKPTELAEKSIWIDEKMELLIQALDIVREVDIKKESGLRSEDMIYQMREWEQERWIFLANGKPPENVDLPSAKQCRIELRGMYLVEEWNAMDGTAYLIDATHEKKGEEDWTMIQAVLSNQDTLLLRLGKQNSGHALTAKENAGIVKKKVQFVQQLETVDYALSEPNACMLDQAEFRLDGGQWEEREELLRIENIIRKRLEYPLKLEAYAQPWVIKKEVKGDHVLELKFLITSEDEWNDIELAVEQPSEKDIYLNDQKVLKLDMGYYVDQSIRKIHLPTIERGENELRIIMPFHQHSNLEWFYLLGGFGVQIMGRNTLLMRRKANICFGNLAENGLPFYGGNVTYCANIDVEDGDYLIEITRFRAPLLIVLVDGVQMGMIAYSPYQLHLGTLSGKHQIKITSFGNRANTFGAVHNCDETNKWFSPSAWRSEGHAFGYEYELKKNGILNAPCLLRIVN